MALGGCRGNAAALFVFASFSACFPTVTFRLGQIVVYYEHEPGTLLLVF